MPRIVQITRDLRPWRSGQDAVVSDELAAKLLEDGDAKDSRPYPPPDVLPDRPPAEKTLTAAQPLSPKRYMTRAEKRAGKEK